MAQRELVKNHIETIMAGQSYSILEFCDDGYSGVGFERPGFKAMTEAARSGGINVIAVKDFSRFGRDYLEVGRYLEFIFPVMQVRFISVNDNYDSNNQAGATGGMGMALKNLVYSIYSRDLAKKVRTAQHTRVKMGNLLLLLPHMDIGRIQKIHISCWQMQKWHGWYRKYSRWQQMEPKFLK